MNTYLIDPRANDGDMFTVEASDHFDAARSGAKRMFPKNNFTIHRETGSADGSGLFQAYKIIDPKTGLLSSYQYMFHVAEV